MSKFNLDHAMSGSIKVFRYGALQPSVHDAAVIAEQLSRATRYRNDLIELAQKRRAAEDAEAIWWSANLCGDPEHYRQLARSGTVKSEFASRDRERRKHSGLGWGTYQLVAKDVQRALKSASPQFRGHDGTGRLCATIQSSDAVTTNEILRGECKAVQLERVPTTKRKHGVRYICKLRLSSDDTVTLHLQDKSELPRGCSVPRVLIVRERIGLRWIYSVHFVLDPKGGIVSGRRYARLTFGERKAAVNFGWRVRTDGVRVAYVVGADGPEAELVIPMRIVGALRHAESLRGLADQVAAAYLGDARRRSRARREAMFTSEGRALEKIRIDGEPLSHEHWARRDRHLYQWERDEVAKMIRQRRELYRWWVRRLARDYGHLVVESFDLPSLIARDRPIEIPEARHVRFLAAPGSLRAEFKAVFGERCEVAKIRARTAVCSDCGGKMIGDRARSIWLRCERCGAAQDQDANNAANQLLDSAAE